MATFAEWTAAAIPVVSGGLRLAVHDDGDPAGAVMTFLHGYPSSSLDVVPVRDRLPGVRVVAPDFPGFGASAKPVGHPYSIHGAADAVEATWAHLGVTSSTLLAHDYGVSVAQELLARQAEGTGTARITGVVWSNGGLYSDLHRQTAGQKLLLDPEQGEAVAAALDEASLQAGIEVTWGERRPMTTEEMHEMWEALAHDGGSTQAHRLLHYVADRLAHGERWIGALESCPLPMHFVWGDLDPVSGGHVADRLEVRLPEVPLDRLTDVGHWPPLEAPDEVAAAVRSVVAAGGAG